LPWVLSPLMGPEEIDIDVSSSCRLPEYEERQACG